MREGQDYEIHTTASSSTKSFGEVQDANYRPTMRSSAVFPLIHKPGKVISIYTFMGYWLRKRNIPLVTALCTLGINLAKRFIFKLSKLIKLNRMLSQAQILYKIKTKNLLEV